MVVHYLLTQTDSLVIEVLLDLYLGEEYSMDQTYLLLFLYLNQKCLHRFHHKHDLEKMILGLVLETLAGVHDVDMLARLTAGLADEDS